MSDSKYSPKRGHFFYKENKFARKKTARSNRRHTKSMISALKFDSILKPKKTSGWESW